MADYKLTQAEREVIIRWDMEEKIAYIDTANPVTIRKLDALVAEFPETYQCVSEDAIYDAKKYTVPASFIRFGKPASEAQKAAGRRLAETRGFKIDSKVEAPVAVLD
jgi:hypothetical protein